MDSKESDRRDLMELVQEFCLSNRFEQQFEKFALDHADEFISCLEEKDEGKESEHPLIYHEIYAQYLKKFEALIEDFIESTGYSVTEFYKECRRVIDTEEPMGSRRFFIETMLATSEYENFYLLMKSEMYSIRSLRSQESKK
eukprot:gene6299-8675_t